VWHKYLYGTMQKTRKEEKQHAIYCCEWKKIPYISQLLLMMVGQNDLIAMDTTFHQ
ncbi:hypothetical protein ILUMI_08440, partial [Ignelater luminosus]